LTPADHPDPLKAMKPKGWAAAGLAVLCLVIAGWRLATGRSLLPDRLPANSRPGGESLRSPAHRDDDRIRNTRADRKAVSAAAQRWHEELLERHPQFRVEFKDVPDEENGFLQFLMLSDELGGAALDLPGDLREMLAGDAPWNPKLVEKWLAENEDLFSRLLAIAEAPEQSIKGIEAERLLAPNAKLAIEIGRLLTAAGRLRTEEGSSDQAVHLYQAVINFARHFEDVELPTFLSQTIALLVRGQAHHNVRQNLLPHLAHDHAALQTWRELLSAFYALNIDGPRLLVGEWNVTTAAALLPQLLDGSINHPDPDALVEAVVFGFSDEIGRMMTGPGPFDDSPISHSPHGLSEVSREFVQSHGTARRNWLKAYAREISASAMNDATFAILLGEPLPVEPVTGKPFVWDSGTRTLSPPPEAQQLGLRLDPFKVP
jgi:hypothetical protein